MEDNLKPHEITATIELLKSSLTDKQILEYLYSEDMRLIQVALLNIEKISSQKEAQAIFNILINHPSEIREYGSFLVNKLMQDKEQRKYFQQPEFLPILEKTICDVNPKVCRNILETLKCFDFKDELFSILIKNANNMIGLLEETNKQKNHMYTKNSFRLYWNLFGIAFLIEYISFDYFKEDILKIIKNTIDFREYTIREKTALILKMLNINYSLPEIKEYFRQLKEDENYYVRSVFLN